jgi:hypothetical protein
MRNILIVGAGPSSYISALTCLEMGMNVSILNPNLDQWKVFSESHLLRKLILKKRSDRKLFRTPINLSQIESKDVEIFENFQYGGLSEIWGGVFLPPTKCGQMSSAFNQNDFENAIKFVEKKITINGNDSEIYQAYRERKFKRQTIKSKPPIAKSVHDGDKNWSAKEAFKGAEFKNINFIDGYLTSIKLYEKNKVQVLYAKENRELESLIFDKVFLGTGVFGTARILMENIENIESILIEDSKTTFGVGFSLRLRNDSKVKKQMSPFSVQADIDSDGEIVRFIQLYEMSEELLRSIKFKFPRIFLRFVNRALGNRLRVIMVFYPSNKSSKISICHSSDKLLVAAKVKVNGKSGRSLSDYAKIFLENNLVFLTPEISFKPGSGVHNGAFTIKMRDENVTKAFEGIKDLPNVHVLGSATMKNISAGPILFGAMVNSRLITKAELE